MARKPDVDREDERLQKAIDDLEHMKMTLPMIERQRDAICAAMVYLLEIRHRREWERRKAAAG